ncbi:glycerol kinase GlpK [Methylobacterium organophilum]|uniref:glycerol kinase GlpK n=1 Tax=Methylobacterium organophilum TaxID=410 RepID=UPI001F13D01E|nr:glycerol kinase GlpK [Methylobacterium organophilum]UMY17282.1 glycerol kinase GlpK [Methylobacterium organophilum]
MGRYVGAIDQGTTSTRFMVFDREARVVARAQEEHAQIYPAPGHVEHDPQEIWRKTVQVMGQALEEGGLAPADLAAIGITNQRETTLIWDRRTGKPLHNALVWQDTRNDRLVAAFAREGGRDRFRAVTGLPLASYFSGLKLRWLLDHVEGARERAEAGEVLFGTIDSWLVWNLTGGPEGGRHLTDVTNASRTQLMALDRLAWDAGMLDVFGIPEAMLPEIVPSSGWLGETTTPFPGVPIAGILGDQQAALFGQTCFRPGEAKNTYGTGCFALMNTGPAPVPSKAGLVTTVGYKLDGQDPVYALEGSIAITGALVQWLRDNLGLIRESAEIERLAASVTDNGGVYFVPAFSGLYAPHWCESARGLIIGLTRYAHRGHIARACLEATAFQTHEVLEAMAADSGIPVTELRADGGMVVNDALMQFQSDILGVAVVRPKVSETTALGAAYAAGLATGTWKGLDDLVRNWSVERRWAPGMAQEERRRLRAGWDRAVRRSFDWADEV